MQQEPIKLNIGLDKTVSVACDQCGNETFNQVMYLRTASKFLTGGDQDTLIPIPTFACSSCNHVNEQFKIKNLA